MPMWALFIFIASPLTPITSAAVVHGFVSEEMCHRAGAKIADFARERSPGYVCVELRGDVSK